MPLAGDLPHHLERLVEALARLGEVVELLAEDAEHVQRLADLHVGASERRAPRGERAQGDALGRREVPPRAEGRREVVHGGHGPRAPLALHLDAEPHRLLEERDGAREALHLRAGLQLHLAERGEGRGRVDADAARAAAALGAALREQPLVEQHGAAAGLHRGVLAAGAAVRARLEHEGGGEAALGDLELAHPRFRGGAADGVELQAALLRAHGGLRAVAQRRRDAQRAVDVADLVEEQLEERRHARPGPVVVEERQLVAPRHRALVPAGPARRAAARGAGGAAVAAAAQVAPDAAGLPGRAARAAAAGVRHLDEDVRHRVLRLEVERVDGAVRVELVDLRDEVVAHALRGVRDGHAVRDEAGELEDAVAARGQLPLARRLEDGGRSELLVHALHHGHVLHLQLADVEEAEGAALPAHAQLDVEQHVAVPVRRRRREPVLRPHHAPAGRLREPLHRRADLRHLRDAAAEDAPANDVPDPRLRRAWGPQGVVAGRLLHRALLRLERRHRRAPVRRQAGHGLDDGGEQLDERGAGGPRAVVQVR